MKKWIGSLWVTGALLLVIFSVYDGGNRLFQGGKPSNASKT